MGARSFVHARACMRMCIDTRERTLTGIHAHNLTMRYDTRTQTLSMFTYVCKYV